MNEPHTWGHGEQTKSREWETNVVLADGGRADIRPVGPADEPALRYLYRHLSKSSRYLRFFSAVSGDVAASIGPHVTNDGHHFALVAELDNEVVGVADYFRQSTHRAEVAFAVSDDQQGRGIGTLLLEHLADVAVAHGIRHFVAEVLTRNTPMRAVFSDAGFEIHATRPETGVVEIVMDLQHRDARAGS